jgi:hypothetical protein
MTTPPAGDRESPFGSFLAIAKKISFTFIAVLADVSINSKALSSAYAAASYNKRSLEIERQR